MTRSHRPDRDGRSGRRGGRRDAAEERVPGLVGHEDGERREHGRLVPHDVGRVDECDLGDHGEERLPEREGVAGVEPAVGELVHGREVQVAELDELPGAGEMEETVAADLACDAPQQQPEHDPGRPHGRRAGEAPRPPAAGPRSTPPPAPRRGAARGRG